MSIKYLVIGYGNWYPIKPTLMLWKMHLWSKKSTENAHIHQTYFELPIL